MGSVADRPASTPIIGRAAELQALGDLIARGRAGHSAVCVVHGEAGIGKTVLLDSAIQTAIGFRVMGVSGVESEMTIGYGALHRLLLPVMDRVPALPEPQRIALEATFGLKVGPACDRFLVGLAVLTLVTDMATKWPVMWVIDDAHWVDRESLDLLGFVGRRLHADRVVLLFGMRDETEVMLPEGLPTLRLQPLSPESAKELLKARAPVSAAVGVATRIVAETGGSPLAIAEVVRALSPAQLRGAEPLPAALPVGDLLERHFQAQVLALSRDAQVLLTLAAADPTSNVSLVRAAARSLGVPLDAEVAVERSGLVSFGRLVEFRHPLVRAAAYAGAPDQVRRRAHQALAGAIDSAAHSDWRAWHRAAVVIGADEDVAMELVRCAEVARSRGGYAADAAFRTRAAELSPDPGRRGQRLLEAAQANFTAGAPRTVVRLLDWADPLLDGPIQRAESLRLRAALDSLDRPAAAAAPLLTAARMLEPLDARAARQTYAEAIAAILVSFQLTADTTPMEVAKAALQALGPARGDDDLVDVMLQGFATRIASGYRDAHPILANALDALSCSSASFENLSRWALLLNYFFMELWEDRTAYSILRKVEQLDRDAGALETLRVRLEGLGHLEMWRGNFVEADRCHGECVDISVALGGDPAVWKRNAIELRGWQGDDQATSRMAKVLLSPAMDAIGAGVIANVARMGLVALNLAQGRYREAFDIAWYLFEIDPVCQGNQVLPEIVEAGARCGEVQAAGAALARLDDRATVAGTDWALGLLARSKALLTSDDRAEDYWREALEYLGRTEVAVELARTHLLFGEWLRRQKRRTHARDHLRLAYESFSDMGARAFEERARIELAATGARARRRPDTSHHLTPQEAQVASLASVGASNAEIAAKLFISCATVDYHLRKVFRKLGLTRRRQLTADVIG